MRDGDPSREYLGSYEFVTQEVESVGLSARGLTLGSGRRTEDRVKKIPDKNPGIGVGGRADWRRKCPHHV